MPQARAAALLAIVLILSAAGPARAQGCQAFDALHDDFLELYPTGGLVHRLAGAEARAAAEELRAATGTEILFLYSGDGPTTGARGRYMFLVVDEAACVLAHGWIDGDAFDRLTISD